MFVIYIDGDGTEHISFFPSEDQVFSKLAVFKTNSLYPEVVPDWWRLEERPIFRQSSMMSGLEERALGEHIESDTPNPKKIERVRVTRETRIPDTADEFWLPDNVYKRFCSVFHSIDLPRLLDARILSNISGHVDYSLEEFVRLAINTSEEIE